MNAIFLIKGRCTLGATRTDAEGNVVENTPARFTIDDAGGSVAVGLLDPKTMKPVEPVSAIFGDWDAAGYLGETLNLLKPRRSANIPDFKAIIQAAYRQDGNDLVCDYCQSLNCPNCIVRDWKDECE